MPFSAPILTPAVVSKLPLGLLGFFGIKNGGQYPQSIAPQFMPTLELMGLLGANYHENVGSAPLVPSVVGFNQTTITVPASEIWLVHSISAFEFTGPGDSYTEGSLVARSTQTGTGSNFHRALSDTFSMPAGNASRVSPGRPGPFWLAPGDQVGAFFLGIVNASTTCQMSPQIEFTRFPF